MKKLLFFTTWLLCATSTYPQNYLINFAGTGGSNTIDSIRVINLMKGTTVSLTGADILNLSLVAGISYVSGGEQRGLTIYPNPAMYYANVEFISTNYGDATIKIFNEIGELKAQVQEKLNVGKYTYQIAGLNQGFYTVLIESESYRYSGKIVNSQKSNCNLNISLKNFEDIGATIKMLKDKASTVNMSYSAGDRLLLCGYSGKYKTVITDILTQSKTCSFDLMECTDKSGNNYGTLKIGTQVWTAENIKSEKLADEKTIPRITDSTFKSPAWVESNLGTGHRLYNWFAVNTGKLCPTGWHVPSDYEWVNLYNYLGGIEVGEKLKASDPSWGSSKYITTNATGYSALPEGYYDCGYITNKYRDVGYASYWWTSTPVGGDSFAYAREIIKEGKNLLIPYLVFRYLCYSVRCIKD